MGPKSTAKGRTRRTHLLGGCATCRRRHVKCDQVRPFCLTCKAVGVTCEGYASNVQWVAFGSSPEKSQAKKADAKTTRRHLYSEQSRASMSTELTTTLSANSVDASLVEIDSWSKNNQSNADNLAVGPFSVLSFNATQVKPTAENVLPPDVLELVEAEPGEELLPTPSTIDPLMSLDDSLQWADLFALDFGNEFLMQQDPFAPIMQDIVPGDGNNIASNQMQDPHSAMPNALNYQNSAAVVSGATPVAVSPLIDGSAPSRDLLSDTHFLLRHFQDNVIDVMAGVPWTIKSPWKSLNLANAVQTLADLTYLGEKKVKHANAANLYGLVSTAARQLAASASNTTPQSADCWPIISDWALLRAKLHLEQSARNEFQGPNKAKYKDQLMATLAVMAACQHSNNQSDVRRYMLEAERVLRLRGLAKREISRKARCLHHIYTWARIVGESTYVVHDYHNYVPAVQNLNLQHHQRPTQLDDSSRISAPMTSSTKHNSRLDDFLRLETQHDSDLEIDEPKEAGVGLHDIHLEDSRYDARSMYLEIYGIPETWLSLVSQTTRLANVMDTLKVSNKETNVAFQNALQKRASRLENMICSFAYKTASSTSAVVIDNDGNAGTTAVLPNQYMVQALNSALVIFFYRRVKDVNPWILQSHIDDVIKALQDFDQTLAEQGMRGPGTAWPAFMAGCEAIAPHRRETLLKWIQKGRTESGLNTYKTAEDIMMEVWKRRDEANNGPSPRTTRSTGSSTSSSRPKQLQWSWVDISREKNSWLMLG